MKKLHQVEIIIILLALYTVPILAESTVDATLFPLPDNLNPNVKFWINIYSKYEQDQIVIHDNKHLHIVYEVVDVESLFPNMSVSEKKIWKQIEKIKDEYRDILRKFATKKINHPESLSEKEKYIYNMFISSPTPVTFFGAANRIRGQKGLKDHFKEGLIRSGQYMPFIVEIYKKHGLPLELTALPHVESSFNNSAYSKFGAAGLWQFTRGTGRRYLKINYTVDERFDPYKATEASAKLLKKNYEILGSWPLALTAYNHGVNGMKRAVKAVGTSDIGVIAEKYQSRQFQFASRNFYAEFLAALHVSQNYKKYFGDIEFEEPHEYNMIQLPYYMTISTLKNKLNLSISEIKKLNPSLRNSVLRSKRRLPKGFALRIPKRDDFDTNEFYAELTNAEKYDRQIKSKWYEVQKGDNLKKISRKYDTSIDELISLNDDIDDIHKIYIGQIIRVPHTDDDVVVQVAQNETVNKTEQKTKVEEPVTKSTVLSDGSSVSKPVVTNAIKWYQIRSGDNLESISNQFNVSVEVLMTINNIENKNQIYAGQLIKLFDDAVEFSTDDMLAAASHPPELSQKSNVASINLTPNETNNKGRGGFDESVEQPVVQNVQGPDSSVKKDHRFIDDEVEFDQTIVIKDKYNRIEKLFNKPEAPVTKSGDNYYIIQKGDNLEQIAKKYNISVDALIKENQILNKDWIVVGQKLKIPSELVDYASLVTEAEPLEKSSSEIGSELQIERQPEINKAVNKPIRIDEPVDDHIYVMPEETLGHFADWLEVKTQELRNLNGLRYGQDIQFGQKIRIKFNKISKVEFMQRRMEYHRALEEDFFASYNVDSVLTHKLKYGENIWYLCNEIYEVPFWLFIKYNPNLNVNRLRKGDKIYIPITTSKRDG